MIHRLHFNGNKGIKEVCCVNHTRVPESMFAQQVCILALCPLCPLSLGKHVQRLQSRVGGPSIQHGLSYKHCTSYSTRDSLSRQCIEKL